MDIDNAVHRLRAALREPLPGHTDFLTLSGYPRPLASDARSLDPPPKESAVLALLYPRGGAAHLLLMRRPDYPGTHGGQVGFPGGKREPGDPDLLRTALREFAEETGAVLDGTGVLGTLSEVYIPPSHYLVTPFVAFAPLLGPLAPDPREVAAIIEAPVAELLRDDIVQHGRIPLATGGYTRELPYFALEGEQVWGATALMLAELRQLLLR